MNEVTIESSDEFLKILDDDEKMQSDRSRFCHAAEAVWLQILDDYPHLKKWVAWNKTIPDKILNTLSEDNDSEVRWWIASRRRLSSDLLEKFSTDDSSSIRERIARNPFTPRHILERLSDDEEDHVASTARERL